MGCSIDAVKVKYQILNAHPSVQNPFLIYSVLRAAGRSEDRKAP